MTVNENADRYRKAAGKVRAGLDFFRAALGELNGHTWAGRLEDLILDAGQIEAGLDRDAKEYQRQSEAAVRDLTARLA